ncbi:hypothetical protein HK102_004328 [Quaeritorhiza haematococci]|nr:hypothetical protein HK102_004328 [Quaeritorhiza haematococci]
MKVTATTIGALLLTTTAVFANKPGVYVVPNDGMVDLGKCHADDMIWQLWDRCGQTSCPEQQIWCSGMNTYLRMTSSYNSWDSRNVFINVLHQAFKSAVKVHWQYKNVCHHGECDVVEIEHRHHPRQMRVEMWSKPKGQGGYQMGHMVIELVGPSTGGMCEFLVGAVGAGVSLAQPIVGAVATIFGGAVCLASNVAWNFHTVASNEALIANSTLDASNTTSSLI